MDRLKNKGRQLAYRVKKDYLTLNNVVLVAALIFCASWVWASVSTMSRNWELEKKLEARQLHLAKLKLEIANMELEREYYRTEEYQELMAREKQGKMLEGETMVVLPENSKAAKEKYNQTQMIVTEEKSNFESWMSFLFPRS
ncbi:septum formation initiator family protein [Candidatus Saccharibacteria bacterium]|nr:septum formation initiator family protein [Candidatus Saccharibacteria bacterium]